MTASPWTLLAESYGQAVERIDVFAALGYRPEPRQAEFHAATEDDVVYGGAAGGGKTTALTAHYLRAAHTYPGLRILVPKRQYSEHDSTTLRQLRAFDTSRLGARLVGPSNGLRRLLFANGSVVLYVQVDTAKDATKVQGDEYQLLVLDERTLMIPAAVEALRERLRTTSPFRPVLGVRSGTNPGGVGHGAVKKIVTRTNYGHEVWTDEHGLTHRFVQAKSTDNPHLDEGYRRILNAIPDPSRRAAMRDGSWTSFDGQFFAEWDHERHVVDAATVHLVRDHLELARLPAFSGMDWGWTAPWVFLTAQQDHDGRLWLFRELTRTKHTDQQQAALICEAEGFHRSQIYADPSMFKSPNSGPATADTYAAGGVQIIRANNSRVPGWTLLHHYLGDGPACVHHRLLGWDLCPRLHVSTACPETIRTLPDLVHDDKKPEDVDTHGEDHHADALRYLVMGAGQPLALHSTADPDAHERPATADLASLEF